MSYGHSAERYARQRLDEILRGLNKAERAYHLWNVRAAQKAPDNDPASWYTHFTMQARLSRDEADNLWQELEPSGAVRPDDAHEGCFTLTWEQETAWLEAKLSRYSQDAADAHVMTSDGYNQAEMERDAASVLKSMNWTYDGFWRPPALTYD